MQSRKSASAASSPCNSSTRRATHRTPPAWGRLAEGFSNSHDAAAGVQNLPATGVEGWHFVAHVRVDGAALAVLRVVNWTPRARHGGLDVLGVDVGLHDSRFDGPGSPKTHSVNGAYSAKCNARGWLRLFPGAAPLAQIHLALGGVEDGDGDNDPGAPGSEDHRGPLRECRARTAIPARQSTTTIEANPRLRTVFQVASRTVHRPMRYLTISRTSSPAGSPAAASSQGDQAADRKRGPTPPSMVTSHRAARKSAQDQRVSTLILNAVSPARCGGARPQAGPQVSIPASAWECARRSRTAKPPSPRTRSAPRLENDTQRTEHASMGEGICQAPAISEATATIRVNDEKSSATAQPPK